MRPIGDRRRAGDQAPRGAPNQPAKGPASEPDAQAELAALRLLVRIEAEARAARDIDELRHLAANETRKFNRARQVFVVDVDGTGRPAVGCVSNVASIDKRSYLIESVDALLARLARERGLDTPVEFDLPAYLPAESTLRRDYPFPELLWVPLTGRTGEVFAGLLLAQDSAWLTDEVAVTRRLAEIYAHAWREIATSNRFRARRVHGYRWHAGAALAAALFLAIPVPMTALAPVEIVSARTTLVSSEADAVIDDVLVESGATVQKGDIVVRLVDTALRNRAQVARQEVIVAEARVRQAAILSFRDVKGRHELGLAEAELAVKNAELAFAEDQLAKMVIRAPAGGIVIYADRNALLGKPVVTGERILEIADPSTVEARIDLALPDAVALRPQSLVRILLDVDPLSPISGMVTRSDYRARPNDSDVLVFRTLAALDLADRPPPRLGLRGTAQIRGDQSVMALYLFRRPLSAARQWLGL